MAAISHVELCYLKFKGSFAEFAEPFFCMSYMKCLSKCPYSKKPFLPRKNSGCAPVTPILAFHPNFYTNTWVFANLPIYRKLIHGNISLVF